MSVKQISVFIENKKGKLAEATRYIADHDINLKALSIADRAYVLETGSIALSGNAKDLLNDESVKRAYLSE